MNESFDGRGPQEGQKSSSHSAVPDSEQGATDGTFLEQLKRCLPTVPEIQKALVAAVNMQIGLIKDRSGTLASAAADDAPWSTQIRTYLLPVVLLSSLAGFVKGSVIGHEIPPLGSWKEPLVSGLIFHLMNGVGMLLTLPLAAALTRKFVTLSDGHANVLSILKAAATPALLAGVFVVLGGLGQLIGIAAGVFSLICLWDAGRVIHERNPAVSGPQFFSFVLLSLLLLGIVISSILMPLVPLDATIGTKL